MPVTSFLAPAGLSGVFTDVESSLKEIRDVLELDEAGERALQEVGGPTVGEVHPAAQAHALAEIRRDLEKYMEAHEKASFTNTELHRAMNLHISNLRLLGGPLESLKDALPRPQLSEGEFLLNEYLKRQAILVKGRRGSSNNLITQLNSYNVINYKCVYECRGSSRAAVYEANPWEGAGNEGTEKLFGEAAS